MIYRAMRFSKTEASPSYKVSFEGGGTSHAARPAAFLRWPGFCWLVDQRALSDKTSGDRTQDGAKIRSSYRPREVRGKRNGTDRRYRA